ncbi:hypothetical protein RTBOTA2_004875 [Rhodotorula toruloides]|uniref:FGENESH: predicted gene_3.104 protein n=1 Tax=Rhodotorula toruloides TaxID=5286 RepID=A0A0K3CAY6_RHOTO|nr:hypothetical protein RTBOTA2_004875 [Rhodotorula toruloides]PRQ75839.1 hypothetical protein AAT19DRAFT_12861 [Rhodotorula toruloides]
MSLETSSPSNPDKPFPLLRLPHELLDTIFEYAYAEDKRPKPLCRDLRQFAQKRLFRSVLLRNRTALAKFCATLDTEDDLGRFVRDLGLFFDRKARVHPPQITEGCVKAVDFAKLLRRVPGLSELWAAHLDDELTRVILEGGLASLKSLEILSITAESLPSIEPQSWTTQLERLPSLYHLNLDYSVARVLLPASGVYENITVLVLADDNVDKWPPYNFGTVFPNLRSFDVTEDISISSFQPIVATLPRTLESLRLTNRCASIDDGAADRGSLDAILPEFIDLEQLYLSRGIFTLPRLVQYLPSAAFLVWLGFGPAAPVTDEFLLQLVDGTLEVYLENLTLDYVNCVRGTTMVSQNYELSPEAADTPFHTYPDWFGPEWPVDCTEAGLRKVLDEAELSGIEVDGKALEVFGWEMDYDREVYDALLSWALETGDCTEAEDVLGVDAVNSFFRDVVGDLGSDGSWD